MNSSSLDPENWEDFRASSHRALDLLIDFLQKIRERKAWEEPPKKVRAQFQAPLPREGRDFSDLIDVFFEHMAPYAQGNLHPLFMGWVNGAGTPIGAVAELLAAGLNTNCGGRHHIGLEVEKQITLWMAEAFDFPRDSSGVFVTGTSMANFLAVLIARYRAGGLALKTQGLHQSVHRFVAYTSQDAHSSIARAMDAAGLGRESLRLMATDSQGAMHLDHLRARVAQDRQAGCVPFLLVGTAGSVERGAVDPLRELAHFAQQEDLWFHVDGAFGAWAYLSTKLKPLLTGLERADSLAFDFHKWAQVPYDAGFLLVRDARCHYETFATQDPYLKRESRGLAQGEVWPHDLGIDLSRGFRALKTWFTFQAYGRDRLVATFENMCLHAQALAHLIESSSFFELRSPVVLNILCFGFKKPLLMFDERALVLTLQEEGYVIPSLTLLEGRPVIRCAFVNHRTTSQDIPTIMDYLEKAYLRLEQQEPFI